MLALAARATHGGPPGLFLLGWGLFASVAGLALVTNFRGAANGWAFRGQEPSAGARILVRVTAIPFAVLGPVMIVIGAVSISQRRTGVHGFAAAPAPLRYVLIAVAVAGAGRSWLGRRGLFRSAGRRGGWRLAIALVSSLAVLVFDVGLAVGQMTAWIAAWVISGVLWLVLLIDANPAGPGAGSQDLAQQDLSKIGLVHSDTDHELRVTGKVCAYCGHVISVAQPARLVGEGDWVHEDCPRPGG